MNRFAVEFKLDSLVTEKEEYYKIKAESDIPTTRICDASLTSHPSAGLILQRESHYRDESFYIPANTFPLSEKNGWAWIADSSCESPFNNLEHPCFFDVYFENSGLFISAMEFIIKAICHLHNCDCVRLPDDLIVRFKGLVGEIDYFVYLHLSYAERNVQYQTIQINPVVSENPPISYTKPEWGNECGNIISALKRVVCDIEERHNMKLVITNYTFSQSLKTQPM